VTAEWDGGKVIEATRNTHLSFAQIGSERSTKTNKTSLVLLKLTHQQSNRQQSAKVALFFDFLNHQKLS
jgi:hypothetical protein